MACGAQTRTARRTSTPSSPSRWRSTGTPTNPNQSSYSDGSNAALPQLRRTHDAELRPALRLAGSPEDPHQLEWGKLSDAVRARDRVCVRCGSTEQLEVPPCPARRRRNQRGRPGCPLRKRGGTRLVAHRRRRAALFERTNVYRPAALPAALEVMPADTFALPSMAKRPVPETAQMCPSHSVIVERPDRNGPRSAGVPYNDPSRRSLSTPPPRRAKTAQLARPYETTELFARRSLGHVSDVSPRKVGPPSALHPFAPKRAKNAPDRERPCYEGLFGGRMRRSRSSGSE
jgi:hypothetical protein